MKNLCRMVNVFDGASKDRINALKTKGVDTVKSTLSIVGGIADNADSIFELGTSVKSLGLKWCADLGLMSLYNEVLAETGADNRMFVPWI